MLRKFLVPFVALLIIGCDRLPTLEDPPGYPQNASSGGVGGGGAVLEHPEGFLIYYDDENGAIIQDVAYDQVGEYGGAMWMWSSDEPDFTDGDGGDIWEEESGGHPSRYMTIKTFTSSDYAGFGTFFDTDQDGTADPVDFSEYYSTGYLTFYAKILSDSGDYTLSNFKVEIQYGPNQTDKETKYVTLKGTDWSSYKIYFTSGTDDPDNRTYYFGTTQDKLSTIYGIAIFTIDTGEAAEVGVDSVRWCK